MSYNLHSTSHSNVIELIRGRNEKKWVSIVVLHKTKKIENIVQVFRSRILHVGRGGNV